MKRREDKDGGFAHTTLGLADNIHTQYSLGDAFMLDFGGMFEAAIDDGTETFRLENKVLESGGVDAYVVAPDVICVGMGWNEREREK